jgi:glutamine cyclotransferase
MDIRLLVVSLFLFTVACQDKKGSTASIVIEKKQYEIKNVFQHDLNAFTEGLFFDDAILYESTGSPESLPETESVFGIVDLATGKMDVKAKLDKQKYFGEGIAKANNKIFQLTYLNKTGFVYDATTFDKIDTFTFDSNEGWGLTNIDDATLVMSDGTDVLTFIDVEDLKSVKKIKVTENGLALQNLNELEFVEGFIYANVYTQNRIVKIDIKDGSVVRSIDLSGLYYDAKNKSNLILEMNGIAYNKAKKTFFITGKMWPNIYEIKILE